MDHARSAHRSHRAEGVARKPKIFVEVDLALLTLDTIKVKRDMASVLGADCVLAEFLARATEMLRRMRRGRMRWAKWRTELSRRQCAICVWDMDNWSGVLNVLIQIFITDFYKCFSTYICIWVNYNKKGFTSCYITSEQSSGDLNLCSSFKNSTFIVIGAYGAPTQFLNICTSVVSSFGQGWGKLISLYIIVSMLAILEFSQYYRMTAVIHWNYLKLRIKLFNSSN